MFEKDLNIAFLLDFYGDVLTQRKRDALDFYYNQDMSLSEIAEEMSISRQGVRDMIKKAEDELFFLRGKVGAGGKIQGCADTRHTRFAVVRAGKRGRSDQGRDTKAA